MAEYRSVTVPLSEEAQRLADLNSICTDFYRCKDMCELLAESLLSMSLGPVVLDALATAIPIAYARPFNGGVRVRVDSLTSTFDSTELQFHESILHMRSKFTAHSVNGMERQQVLVWLNPEELGGRCINNVNIAQNHLAALSPADYQRLAALCAKALAWLEIEVADEAVRLQAIILNRYPIDSLYEQDSAGLMSSDSLDRARFARSRASHCSNKHDPNKNNGEQGHHGA